MIQRGGEVVIRMLDNVQQRTIKPLIQATIALGTCIYTDEYAIYSRLEQWGYGHESVCHSRGEYARDDDGDGFYEVHVNTMEGPAGAFEQKPTVLMFCRSSPHVRRCSCYTSSMKYMPFGTTCLKGNSEICDKVSLSISSPCARRFSTMSLIFMVFQ
jgi:hypothetical protein